MRGLNFTLAEVPVGVGGPLTPVVTNPATAQGTPGTSVATNALELGVLGEPQDNYSMQGTIAAIQRLRDSDLTIRPWSAS